VAAVQHTFTQKHYTEYKEWKIHNNKKIKHNNKKIIKKLFSPCSSRVKLMSGVVTSQPLLMVCTGTTLLVEEVQRAGSIGTQNKTKAKDIHWMSEKSGGGCTLTCCMMLLHFCTYLIGRVRGEYL
jgi:hypothetical protein